jgi:hypothetical protein
MNASMYEFNTMEGAAGYYDTVMRAADIYLERLGMAVHILRYEDLVGDFEANTNALCDFLGVDRVDLTGFSRTAAGRAITTPSSTQVTRGLYGEGVDQWRRYAFALDSVMPVLAPWIPGSPSSATRPIDTFNGRERFSRKFRKGSDGKGRRGVLGHARRRPRPGKESGHRRALRPDRTSGSAEPARPGP